MATSVRSLENRDNAAVRLSFGLACSVFLLIPRCCACRWIYHH